MQGLYLLMTGTRRGTRPVGFGSTAWPWQTNPPRETHTAPHCVLTANSTALFLKTQATNAVSPREGGTSEVHRPQHSQQAAASAHPQAN